jgi:hypothetical protein
LTFATLSQVHDELVLNSANTTYDTELNNLLALVDAEITTLLRKYSSQPVQSEIATQFAYIEARMVAIHFRIKRATPQEQQQLQSVLKNNQALLSAIIDSNFKTNFSSEGSRSDYEDGPTSIPWGNRGQY